MYHIPKNLNEIQPGQMFLRNEELHLRLRDPEVERRGLCPTVSLKTGRERHFEAAHLVQVIAVLPSPHTSPPEKNP